MADYRLIVTASRQWTDRVAIAGEIGFHAGRAEALGLRLVVVHGACPKGGDAIADQVCRMQGIAVERHPARWQGPLRKGAGYARNREMIALGAHAIAAFALACGLPQCAGAATHPTHGTGQCASEARKAGIPVTRIGAGWAA